MTLALAELGRSRLTSFRAGTRHSARRVAGLAASAALAASILPVTGPAAAAPPATCGVGCQVTVDALDFPTQTSLASFNFIVNDDNSKKPNDPLSLSTESHSPIVAEGGDAHPTVILPDGRYMISVRSLDHKMWGAYITLPDDAADDGTLTVHVALTVQSADNPLPLGKINVFVFNDNTWTNGAPDTEEAGLGGFQVELKEQTDSAVTVDYNNDPLCGGICLTSSSPATLGFVSIPNLGPATYFIDVHAPDGPCNSDPDSQWYQTTTIDGGLSLLASVEEGSDGTGAPGEQLWEPPNIRTAYWFGFVCAPRAFTNSGTGEITGTARNWVEWAPYTFGTVNDPVVEPFVALSDASTDQTVFVGRGDGAGNFDIQGVPPGDYNLAVWDEQLSYIMRFKPVHIDAGGPAVDVNETGDDDSVGLGVSRWFGWLDGYVYKDTNGNGMLDPGEPTLANTDVDQRWRDGSIKEGTITDPDGYYVYPTAEGGALGRWIVDEQGFARFSSFPGASAHDERTGEVTPSCVTVDPVTGDPVTPANPCIPNAEGGGLLMNELMLEGHRTTVDWGKRDYPAGTPGQIVGITYFSTTRNEFVAALQAHEDYEPAIPDVTVLLETPGPDHIPNTPDDVVVNTYSTDHWAQPDASEDPQDNGQGGPNDFTQNCNPIEDFNGGDVTNLFNPALGPHCLEVPLTGARTRDGKFDGGYAFADYCPNGIDTGAPDPDSAPCWNAAHDDHIGAAPLVAGTYLVHAIMPADPNDGRPCNPPNDGSGYKSISGPFGDETGAQTGCLWRVVREEDVNVDLGNNFGPAIPPPPCIGDDHVLDQDSLVARSPYFGDPSAHAKLCDKKLVVLQNQQNANADFNMMTNFRTDPNGENASDTRTGDVAEPGRLIGQVFNDIYFERDIASPWYGEPRPIPDLPVGIYARVDTNPNVNQPYDANNWRLIKTLTTSDDGAYEALLPSTETWNCPIPQGPCPGMYIAIVNDPGVPTAAHPHGNPGYNPNVLTANTPFEVWPGLTTQLDTPVDPISGTACEDPAGGATPDPSDPARPDVLQVSRPYVLATDAGTARRITILSDFIGSGAGTVRLTDWATGAVTNLTTANGGIVSWTQGNPPNGAVPKGTPDTIVIQVPPVSAGFLPGPKQLTLITSNANGAAQSVNGITLHVLYADATIPPRTDIADTQTPTFVRDTATVAGDLGRTATVILQTGFAPPTLGGSRTITAPVVPGVGFTINAAATASGTRIVTIGRTDPGTLQSGSNIVLDTNAVTADITRTVTMIGTGWGFNLSRTITAVNPGVSFTVSGNPATASGARTFTITRSEGGAVITNTGTTVFDPSITSSDVGKPVSGTGVAAGATISTVNPGVSFVMSLPATSTVIGTTLTIGTTTSVTPYNPTVTTVAPPTTSPADAHLLQAAIDAAPAGSLVVLSPGTYNENILLWKPLKLQGLGPGGIVGAHELQGRDPEDPRFNITGTVIDGRFHQRNLDAFNATVAANGPYALANAPLNVVLSGAAITAVAQSTSAYDVPSGPAGILGAARIDGVAVSTGLGQGAGGVQLMANINNLQLTNNVLENNGGVFAGGIGLGQLFARNSHNWNVRIDRNRIIGNGGLTTSGGVGVFYGSNGYEIANSVICSNFSVEYGAGISHIGLSPNGSIHDNRIYYNEAVDSGGGIAIEGELAVGSTALSDGSGSVNVDRNLIQSNTSVMDDGGGVFVLDALAAPINIRNNMIVNNVAADLGGAIMLDDASRVTIANNTIANNATTASSENSAIGVPHGAGLTSEANDPLWQTAPAYAAQYPNAGARPFFSNPVALFNNIFWNNDAMTLSQFGPGATLIDNGFIDFEITGTCTFHTTCAADTFTPRFSDLTNGQILRATGTLNGLPGGQGNLIGADPLFVAPFINELTVGGARLDPQQASVTITGQDPPVGLTGDYHIGGGSPAVNAGAGFSNLAATTPRPANQTPNAASILAPCSGTTAQAYPADFDQQWRPRGPATNRTPWDLGADEVQASTQVTIPKTTGTPTFNWNGAPPQLQCAASTVPVTP